MYVFLSILLFINIPIVLGYVDKRIRERKRDTLFLRMYAKLDPDDLAMLASYQLNDADFIGKKVFETRTGFYPKRLKQEETALLLVRVWTDLLADEFRLRERLHRAKKTAGDWVEKRHLLFMSLLIKEKRSKICATCAKIEREEWALEE